MPVRWGPGPPARSKRRRPKQRGISPEDRPYSRAAPPSSPKPKPRYTVPTAQPARKRSPQEERRGRAREREQTRRTAERITRRGRSTAALFKAAGYGQAAKPSGFGVKFAKDLIEAGLYTPFGLYEAGKAVKRDVEAAGPVRGSILGGLHRQKPDVSFKRTRKLGKTIANQVYEDIRHPGRHPGYTALDALALLSAGAGTVSRVGAAGRAGAEAARAGGGAARVARAVATRPGYKGGALTHRPAARELPLKVRGRTVATKLEPDNPLLRPITRARVRAANRQLAQEGRPEGGPVGRAYNRVLGAENLAGRELRAARRIPSQRIGRAESLRAARAKLTRNEQAALRVLAVEGEHALRHPDEAVTRHVRAHQQWAEEGIEPELNRTIAADTAEAGNVLRDIRRHPRLIRVATESRRLSRESGGEHIRRGFLTPEAEVGSRATIAEAYGRTGGAPKGSFYFPTSEWFKPGGKVSTGKPYSPRPGPTGMGPPQISLRGTGKRRTGKGVRKGVVEDVAGAIAENVVTRERRYSAEDMHRLARSIGTETKIHENQIGIRSTRKIRAEHRELVRAEEAARRSGDETALARATEQRLRLQTDRENPLVEGAIGAKIPGVRWVDEKFLKPVEGGPAGDLARVAATVNKPFRMFGVYLRPGYVATNLPGNVAMGVGMQGVKVFRNFDRALASRKTPVGREIETALGTARTESYKPRSRAGKAEEKIVGGIMNITDRDARVAAFYYRAAERGYKNDAAVQSLLRDPKLKDDYNAVVRRARKDAVDFDSLTPSERALTEAIYFYPWTTRGSGWAGRFIAQRPIKAGVTAQLAQQGKQRSDELLGTVPSWLQGYIPTRYGLANPHSVFTPSTPAQIGQFAVGQRRKDESLAEQFGTPLLEATGAPVGEIPGRTIGSTAPAYIAKRLGVENEALLGKPSKTFPQTGIGPALGPFVAGGLYPRRADMEQLAEQAKKERREKMSAPERVREDIATKRREYFDAAKKAGILPKDAARQPESVRRAFALRGARALAYARAEEQAGKQLEGLEGQRAKFAADQRLLLRLKVITPDQAKQATAWGERASEKALKKARRYLGDNFFGGAVLEAATRQINAHGGDVSLR